MKVRKFSISSVLRQSLIAVPHKGTTSLEWKSEKRSKSPLKIIPFWWMDGRDEKGNLSVWISIGDLRVISQTVHTHIFGFFFGRFWAQGKELCWCFRFTSKLLFFNVFQKHFCKLKSTAFTCPCLRGFIYKFCRSKAKKTLVGRFCTEESTGKFLKYFCFLG